MALATISLSVHTTAQAYDSAGLKSSWSWIHCSASSDILQLISHCFECRSQVSGSRGNTCPRAAGKSSQLLPGQLQAILALQHQATTDQAAAAHHQAAASRQQQTTKQLQQTTKQRVKPPSSSRPPSSASDHQAAADHPAAAEAAAAADHQASAEQQQQQQQTAQQQQHQQQQQTTKQQQTKSSMLDMTRCLQICSTKTIAKWSARFAAFVLVCLLHGTAHGQLQKK